MEVTEDMKLHPNLEIYKVKQEPKLSYAGSMILPPIAPGVPGSEEEPGATPEEPWSKAVSRGETPPGLAPRSAPNTPAAKPRVTIGAAISPGNHGNPSEVPKGSTSAAPGGSAGQKFRLQKINEIQKYLESERKFRLGMAKKYQRAINVMSFVSMGLEAASISSGAVGIGLLTTIIAAPAVIALEALALGAGGISIVGNLIKDKILILKVKKHSQIMMLAQTKLNTIQDLVSKALKDDMICEREFSLILNELNKYNTMKEEFKHKARTTLDEQTKKSLIKQGKEQAVIELREMIEEGTLLKRRN